MITVGLGEERDRVPPMEPPQRWADRRTGVVNPATRPACPSESVPRVPVAVPSPPQPGREPPGCAASSLNSATYPGSPGTGWVWRPFPTATIAPGWSPGVGWARAIGAAPLATSGTGMRAAASGAATMRGHAGWVGTQNGGSGSAMGSDWCSKRNPLGLTQMNRSGSGWVMRQPPWVTALWWNRHAGPRFASLVGPCGKGSE